MPDILDILELPVETDEYIGPLLVIEWDGTPTTDVDIAITRLGSATPPAFTAYPGPKLPTTTGPYLIQIRKQSMVRDLPGLLIMTDR